MIAAIVPASGTSSRIGSPKALLDAGGPSFLERVVHASMAGGCAPVLVVTRDGRSPVAAMARKVGARVVENPDPDEGPISSLRRGIEALPPGVAACLFFPVDHPLVLPETVTQLVQAFRERRAAAATAGDAVGEAAGDAAGDAAVGGAERPAGGDGDGLAVPPVVVPTHGGRRGHPVLFAARVFGELLEEGLEEGARTVVHRHDEEALEVPVDDPGVLTDIDTLAEYRRHFPDAFRKRFQSR